MDDFKYPVLMFLGAFVIVLAIICFVASRKKIK